MAGSRDDFVKFSDIHEMISQRALSVCAIITHFIARRPKPRPLRQQNQPGPPSFLRVILKTWERPGYEVIENMGEAWVRG